MVALKQFSVALDGNLLVPSVIDRQPLCELLLPQCISESTVPVTFANSPSDLQLRPEGELTNHGHMVRAWNTVTSGSAKVYRTSLINYTNAEYFHPAGTWGANANNAPQNGFGDPAGTTDGTGGNKPHNTYQPVYGVYRFRRVK